MAPTAVETPADIFVTPRGRTLSRKCEDSRVESVMPRSSGKSCGHEGLDKLRVAHRKGRDKITGERPYTGKGHRNFHTRKRFPQITGMKTGEKSLPAGIAQPHERTHCNAADPLPGGAIWRFEPEMVIFLGPAAMQPSIGRFVVYFLINGKPVDPLVDQSAYSSSVNGYISIPTEENSCLMIRTLSVRYPMWAAPRDSP